MDIENSHDHLAVKLHKGTDAPDEEVGWWAGKWVSREGTSKGGGEVFLTVGCAGDAPEGVILYLWVLEQQQMKQKVDVDADAMADEISKNGHIALYGINFATGKSEITPDSGVALEQIAALLSNKSDWKL